jgi:hypothetical protein
VLLIWSLALFAGQVWSHDLVFPLVPDAMSQSGAGPLWRALAAVPDLGWLAAVVVAALLVGVRRPRRALSAVLAALVVALAFHAAWRAEDPSPHSIQARDRAVDSAHAHLSALPVEASALGAPTLVPLGDTIAQRSLLPRSASIAPAPGRAPPFRSS